MTTQFNLRKLLHRKAWEMCTPSISALAPVNTAAGSFVTGDKFDLIPHSLVYFVQAASAIYRYDGDQDAWLQLPNSGIAGIFAAGACGEFRALGAMGGIFTQTATGGGASTINTDKTIAKNLAGCRIRAVAGLGVGFDGLVVSNTIGANSVITTSAGTFNNTTQFQVFSGSLWFMNAGTSAVGFAVYDRATNTWTARSVSGLPTAWGTDAALVGTMNPATPIYTGQSTGSNTSTTLNNTGKSWGSNMWANSQVRITGGTGSGQIRAIASNTGTALTVSVAWTITPDATSTYAIEANEDYLYLMGNNTGTLYRFGVTGNAWSTLAPGVARAAAMGAGGTASHIVSVAGWNNETQVATGFTGLYKQNGRYIFSFRGGGSAALDAYDIAANAWVSTIPYGNQFETFTTGSCYCDDGANIYIQKEATGRIFKFDTVDWDLEAFTANPGVQGATVAGQKMFLLPYTDGATKIPFIYTQAHTQNTLYRTMVI
jgi:hypothetical protein